MHKKRRPEDHGFNIWRSYSDMMAGVLLLFVLIMCVTLFQAQKSYNESLQERDEKIALQEEYTQELLDKQNALDKKDETLQNQDAQLKTQDEKLAEQEQQLAALAAKLKEQESTLNAQQSALDEKTAQLKDQQAQIDQIIGVIGEAGSGKSVLIKGMFPGLELTNDDDGVNVRPLPILDQDAETGFFSPHTYHMDIRFEMGFHQLSELADAIQLAVRRGKRVVIEHFDLIYPLLGANANLLIGVGEEIIITRPTIFGPEPQEVYQRAYDSLPYRLMAHTAEDLCECFLPPKELERCSHDDVHHGFILAFPDTAPELDLDQLEQLQNMGDLSQIADMLPAGMAKGFDASQIDEKQMAHNKAIIRSMTPKERENPQILNASRKRRIAAGCGLTVEDVNKLLKQYDMMQKMMKKVKRNPKGFMRGLGNLGGMGGFKGFGR